ncbi:hypothetical protein CH249_15400 [Rhodococcus sp. 05-2255-3B1]|nr:hypothetical protein CH250_23465 [Rhodococcus sp. 05-2255-3C]OZE09565.1 hypothetical protein CH249_15400 [Rhodococcus sp. 05-2255-3B1]OZE14831.1 hypothetical protein CH255_21745 [Rhodococcus sp. 05-2255-2A2]
MTPSLVRPLLAFDLKPLPESPTLSRLLDLLHFVARYLAEVDQQVVSRHHVVDIEHKEVTPVHHAPIGVYTGVSAWNLAVVEHPRSL